MARNLACQWGKNSWQCASGCVAMRVRWSGASHVVVEMFKNFFQGVTTCHDYTVKCTYTWHSMSYISWTVRNLCVTGGTTWHDMTQTVRHLVILRSIAGTKFVPLWGLLYTYHVTNMGRLWWLHGPAHSPPPSYFRYQTLRYSYIAELDKTDQSLLLL